MNPYQTGDEERSVLVLDNAWVHHEKEVRQLCEAFGIIIEFLPPYSPDFMPIERAFGQAKMWMRRSGGS